MTHNNNTGIYIHSQTLSKRLTPLQKLILSEISALDNGCGCYASNAHIASVCGCSVWSVSTTISQLKKDGVIFEKSFNGRTRVLTCDFHKADIGFSQGSNVKFTRQTCEIPKQRNIIIDNIIMHSV